MTHSKPIIKFFKTETELQTFGSELANKIDGGIIIFLSGSLGAGKTTFARGFIQGMGHRGKVKSPTYTLVEPYEINDKNIFHFDFYRLHDAKELEHMGIHEYFSPHSICLIEWPEKGMAYLPPADLSCFIEFDDGGRQIKLEAQSPHGEKILKIMRSGCQ